MKVAVADDVEAAVATGNPLSSIRVDPIPRILYTGNHLIFSLLIL